MTNEEKAEELSPIRKSLFGTTPIVDEACYKTALKMAEWKDKHPSKELIGRIISLYIKFEYNEPKDKDGYDMMPEDWIAEQLK